MAAAAVVGVSGILELIKVLAPVVTNFVTLIRHKDGTLTLVQVLDEDTAEGAANIQQALQFLASKKTAPPA